MIESLRRDLRHAARGLAARPTHAVVVVATLALVIGAASAVLSVVNATMVRPLPYPDNDRLVQLFLMPPGATAWSDRNPLNPAVLQRFRERLRQVETIEGLWSRERALGGDVEPETVTAGAVSAGLFALFGGSAALGRTFTEPEDRDNARVVVLGHSLWQRRFGADPAIVGQTVLIDREPHEVIGVMPAGFVTAFTPTELWTPLNAASSTLAAGSTFVLSFARLRPGVSPRQLDAELVTAMEEVAAESPTVWTGWRPTSADVRDAQFRLLRPSLLALVGAMAALVLLAAANLANLTLAQIVTRRPELALRAALGGGRLAVLRLQLAEAVLLAVAGGLAGVLLGGWSLPALLALDPALARTVGDVALDWRVQLATAALTVLVVLVAGVLPLVRELGGDLARGIADGNRRAAGSRRDHRMRAWLVGAECALAVVLLAAGALLLSAFSRASQLDPGFDPRSVLGAQLRLSATAYPSEAARGALIDRVLEQVRGIPGVESAGATLNRFVPGFSFVTPVRIEGQPRPDGDAHTVQFRRGSPGYFETMRIPVLRGRAFLDRDGPDAPPVAVVSQRFADQHWPGQDPIGRRLLRGASPNLLTVVGVVGDVSDVGFGQPPAPTVYVAFSQNNVAITPVSLVVRTTGDPLSFVPAVRAAVFAADPAQPIDSVTTLERFLDDSLGPQRFRSTLLLGLGGIGLLLAGLGVYGVTARSVEERSRELGVRQALGASPAALLRMVLAQALAVVGVGMAIGGALATGAVALLLRTLPNLEQAERWWAVPAVAALLLVAAAAALVPARRALAVEPMAAVRAE
ncbi:MAG: ADOP family duplicated permease [Vicinamibacterales bacterium]